EIAGEEGEEPERKKREMGKKKCFVVIKPRVRRIVSVGISSVFQFQFSRNISRLVCSDISLIRGKRISYACIS
ncbi:unnamed protein product, partial [Brassica oleracea var. botrytis]